MVDVAVTRVLHAPRSLVAAVAGDPSQAVRWYSNIRSVRWHGEPAVRPGARIDFVARFLGRDLTYTYEIVDLVPGRRLVMRTASGPFPMETTYSWWDEPPGPDGPRTGMELRNAGRPQGFSRVAAGALPVAMRRAMTKDLQRLEEVLREEQSAGPSP